MKYTDRWFKFPIKVYDYVSIKEAQRKEEEDGIKIDGEWAAGYYYIVPDDIIGWSDTFTRPRSPKDGCNATLVMLRDEEVTCVWNSQKFADKLNAFVEKHEEMLMAEEGEIQKLAEEETDNDSIT